VIRLGFIILFYLIQCKGLLDMEKNIYIYNKWLTIVIIINKQLLDMVFVISRIIKVKVVIISQGWSPRLITLTKTFIILDITETESNNNFLVIHWMKKYRHVLNLHRWQATQSMNLTWLPLEITHCSHKWHNYWWPRVSLTWLLYNLQLDDVTGTDFKNSLYAFGQSKKK